MTTTELIYIDDSGAKSTGLVVYGWTTVPTHNWNEALGDLLALRQHLEEAYAIPKRYELHATKFVGGRGNPSLDVSWNRIKRNRPLVVDEMIEVISGSPWMTIGSIASSVYGTRRHYQHEKLRAYGELINMLDSWLDARGAVGIIIMDGDGSDRRYTTAHRSLNLKTRNIIEDPFFINSHTSQWIQVADLIAYSAYQCVLHSPAKEFTWDWYPRLKARDAYGGTVMI